MAGNSNSGRRPDKAYREALLLAATREHEGGDKTKLQAIADKTIELALDGHSWAILEVGNRIDGRAQQSIETTIRDERPTQLEGLELGRAIMFALDQASRDAKLINSKPLPSAGIEHKNPHNNKITADTN